MTKAVRGTKRTCQSCGIRFYDLGKEPPTCPACGQVFAVETRRPARAAPTPAPAPAKPVVAEEAEDDTKPESEDAEIVSLEDAEESDDDDAAVVDDEEVVEIDDDDAGIGGDDDDDDDDSDNDDDDDTFLQDDDEDGDTDVSGIIGGPAKKKDD